MSPTVPVADQDRSPRVLSRFQIGDVDLLAYDDVGSKSAQWIAWELERDDYGLRGMHCDDGDVVIDIGAHVGLFSMYLARRWPTVTVLAFEPFPANYRNLVTNLRMNNIRNVEPARAAITGDGRRLSMTGEPGNSGGASAVVTHSGSALVQNIRSSTLEEVFATKGIGRCKLLKIDCEGMEYEILHATEVLDRVDYLAGEFHSSPTLRRLGHDPQRLLEHCARHFRQDRLTIQVNQLAD